MHLRCLLSHSRMYQQFCFALTFSVQRCLFAYPSDILQYPSPPPPPPPPPPLPPLFPTFFFLIHNSEETVTTPFGDPVDSYMIGQLENDDGTVLEGCELVFLPRHGRGTSCVCGAASHSRAFNQAPSKGRYLEKKKRFCCD